jgi:hypothetical protein
MTRMPRIALLAALTAALLALAPSLAVAEQMRRLGPYQAHYVVVQSTFFSKQIAERYQIVRGRDRAIMNLSVLGEEGLPVRVEPQGVYINLLEQRFELPFREIREGTAVYYLAEIRHTDRETLRFRVSITTPDGVTRELEFQQQMYWDDR